MAFNQDRLDKSMAETDKRKEQASKGLIWNYIPEPNDNFVKMLYIDDFFEDDYPIYEDILIHHNASADKKDRRGAICLKMYHIKNKCYFCELADKAAIIAKAEEDKEKRKKLFEVVGGLNAKTKNYVQVLNISPLFNEGVIDEENLNFPDCFLGWRQKYIENERKESPDCIKCNWKTSCSPGVQIYPLSISQWDDVKVLLKRKDINPEGSGYLFKQKDGGILRVFRKGAKGYRYTEYDFSVVHGKGYDLPDWLLERIKKNMHTREAILDTLHNMTYEEQKVFAGSSPSTNGDAEIPPCYGNHSIPSEGYNCSTCSVSEDCQQDKEMEQKLDGEFGKKEDVSVESTTPTENTTVVEDMVDETSGKPEYTTEHVDQETDNKIADAASNLRQALDNKKDNSNDLDAEAEAFLRQIKGEDK